MDLDFVSVHNHAKKELGQYPAILTSHLVNNPYVSEIQKLGFTDFFSKGVENYSDFEKLAHVIQRGLQGFTVKSIEGESPKAND